MGKKRDRSWFYDRARRKAERIGRDEAKTARVLAAATRKAERRSGPIAKVLEELATLVRMVGAWVKGDYRDVPWQSIVLALGTLVYFVSPVDSIPDAIPVLGLADDAMLIRWTVRSIRSDIDDFAAWEKRKAAG